MIVISAPGEASNLFNSKNKLFNTAKFPYGLNFSISQKEGRGLETMTFKINF